MASTMMRYAGFRLSPLRRQVPWRRSFAAATSAQKRALEKSQLAGESSTEKSPAPPPAGGTSTPPPASPPSGGSSFVPIAAVGLFAVGGAAYYFYSTKDQELVKETPKQAEAVAKPAVKGKETRKHVEAVAKPAVKEKETSKKAEVVAKPVVKEKETPKQAEAVAKPAVAKDKGPKTTTKEEPRKETAAAPTGNRVSKVEVPGGKGADASTFPPPAHPASDNRVSTNVSAPVSAQEAAKELRASSEEEASETLQRAHAALRANLDESLFADLEKLNVAELRVRVVQLAAEMKDSTKWEAVRLKEFLAMKEKETADKYMELMQKQRLELETQLARSLREQEDILSRQAQAALQQMEDSIQEVVQATATAQEAEHEADLASAKERLETELNTKYEADYGKKLAQEKSRFVEELETKASLLQELSSKVQQLEAALKESRTFETGSLRAHRLSAAALALGEKLETSKEAAAELTALKSAAKDNVVIESALSAVPSSIASGIPTVSELQTRFEPVYKTCRQAAMVPAGRAGLEGQLLGMAFSTVKYAPNPDEAAPEHAKDDAEYVLARARRHVQLGELERAVEQLDKLKGQAAFTVKDWKQSAMDRIAINKTVRTIKMESAMLNESLSAGGGGSPETA